MAVQNKVTKVYPIVGAPILEPQIQDHFDAMNADGWELVCLESLTGWYRFFWKKDVS